jgi:hypothetical protein
LSATDPDRQLIARTEIGRLYHQAANGTGRVSVQRLILDVRASSQDLAQACAFHDLDAGDLSALTSATWNLEQTPLHPTQTQEPKRSESSFRKAFRKQNRRDWIWSLGRALVAATAYALTIYNDHWGTLIDFLTAFTTGFLTETVVSWAVLPVFQSIRGHWRERTAGGGDGPSKKPPPTRDGDQDGTGKAGGRRSAKALVAP